MLRIIPNQSGRSMKRYFTSGYERDSDLTRGDHVHGTWHGLGAAALGLSGTVKTTEFACLCDNVHPVNKTGLTQRVRADRRVGYDFNFHCPKSVTLMYELTTRPEFVECLRLSMKDAMNLMEQHAATRVRMDGSDDDRLTGNMVYAEFVHHTARPVNGVADPLLHGHCFVFNATHDPVEKRWKALQVGHIKQRAPYYEAVFHSCLAKRVRELGYEIVQSGRFWEIKGVARGLIERFSRRTDEINAVARAAGISDPREKSGLGARTRRSKYEGLRGESLREEWRSKVDPQELIGLLGLRAQQPLHPHHPSLVAAVRKQMGIWFMHAATVESHRFIESVLRSAFGHGTPVAVRQIMQEEGMIERLVDGKVLTTTPDVLAEEAKLVGLAMDGRGQFPTLCDPLSREATLLDEDHRLILNRLFASRDLISILEGSSHSGKSDIMEAAGYALAHRAHHSVTRLAARGRGDRGDGQRHIRSVDEFLNSDELQKSARGGVIVLDDAQLIGTTPMTQLVSWASRARTRLVLLHDRNEALRSRRGDSEPLLRMHAGLAAYELGGSKTLSNPHRAIVQLMESGQIGQGLQKLQELQCVHEVCGEQTTLEAVATDYARSATLKLRVAVVAHDPFSQTAITRLIREQLHAVKLIKRSRTFAILSPVHLDSAAKASQNSYVSGLVIQFTRNTGWKVPYRNIRFGFRAGSRWKVVGHDVWGNVMLTDGKALKALPLSKADRFDVYRSESLQVAAGDMIRITRNGKAFSLAGSVVNDVLDLRNRKPMRDLSRDSVHRVKRITRRGDLHLDNGLIVPKDYGHLDHGYCLRPEQLKNTLVDRVLLHVPKFSFDANYTAQFCMSVARGRRAAAIYTTSYEGLREAVTQEHNRVKGLDLLTSSEWAGLVRHGTEMDHSHAAERELSASDSGSTPGMEL